MSCNSYCQTEECLIDFQEIVGQHSGENMAAEFWEALERFGLTGRVRVQ
jgi:hypothetical protein